VKLTEAIVEVYGVPKEAVIVQLKEDDPENVGVGGVLLLDRKH
jgi:phenylpyruvate tautomerase PptA (4-oxalocrotonate tautomerase family)